MYADLNKLFTWNTNMVLASIICEYGADSSVTVWDQRILRTDTENHVLNLSKEYVEYYLTDIKKKLKGNDVKVYFRWEVMSTVGLYYADMVEIGSFKTPNVYSG